MPGPSFHPELRNVARLLPRGVGRAWLMPVLKLGPRHGPPARLPPGITFHEKVLGPARVRVFVPDRVPAPRPAVLWIHGGGFICGSARLDDGTSLALAQELGAVVVSAEYRLAPEHPFPAPLEDCLAAYEYLHADAASLGVDPAHVIIAGQSAGGGLAAGLSLMLRDRGRPPPLMQVLVYPMLDDRTALRSVDGQLHRLWDQASNQLGWSAYLGRAPGGEGVSQYAAPARCQDLTGLPRTWLGVGTADLFHAEDVAYADRLRAAGVPVDFHLVEGAFHGFDVVAPGTACAREFLASQVAAMRRALEVGAAAPLGGPQKPPRPAAG